MTERVVIDGELFVPLAAVATCFRVEISFVEDVYQMGLVRGRRRSGTIVIEACELDRFARIVRLHRHEGIKLEAVAVLVRLP